MNYNLAQTEMGMVGLRDLFVVTPASTFHHHHEQPHYSDNHPPPHSIHGSSNPATALGVGIVPFLAATPCLDNETMMSNRNRGGSGGIQGIQFWQDQQPLHYLKNNNVNVSHENYIQSGGSGDGGGITVSGTNSGGTTTCQDCGNQAKKDCSNRRCRTCCKSRGFDCPTHVKSTWVPAARRRERQLMQSASIVGGGCSTASTSGAKKPKLISSHTTTNSHTSTSNTTPPRSFDTSSSHQDGGIKEPLPGQIRAPAVFKCVKVTAVEDGGDDEYAYQAVVKIGGHVFKGFLYDQGVENRDVCPILSELHLGGGNGSGTGGSGSGRNGVSSSSPMMDPSDVYGGVILGGSNYGNPID